MLPRREGGADVGVRKVIQRIAKVSLQFGLILLVSFFACPLDSAFGCTKLEPQNPASVFKTSTHIFVGVPVDAKSLAEIRHEDGWLFAPLVRVTWRVQEVFKGDPVSSITTITSNIVCVGPQIVVGAPYIVAVDEADFDDASEADLNEIEESLGIKISRDALKGVAGMAVESGTFGALDKPEQYKLFLDAYKKLGQFK
jgi:hypothetical protein